MERKRTDRQYHVEDNADVVHKDVKIYCNKNQNQLSSLQFFGSNSKSNGTRGLSKIFYLCFDPKLGNGVCAIFCILCACVTCTSILEKPWISGIPL